ncbi:MAG: hypothetical protein HC855_09310 [Rhizobiales bacterium]|nr:hypothetical protein [Hyphomicrobiales bacterium]
MEVVHIAYLFASATGICAAGSIGSLWTVATGDSPGLGILFDPRPMAVLGVMALVLYAPLYFIKAGAWNLVARPIRASILIAAGLGWSFLEGVFILTQFFGAT